jgi:hypothetical protein
MPLVIAVGLGCLTAVRAADGTMLVLTDDFEAAAINNAKWRLDEKGFGYGVYPDAAGDVVPTQAGGVVTFAGYDNQAWWYGAALMTVPTFSASVETNLVFSIDRVSDAGEGTAVRSAIWITDPSRANYVLFADNHGEGGWQYNRQIGTPDDNAVNVGAAISAFTDAAFTDRGLHRMKVVANGRTAKLYLDDVFGAEVKFPFATNLVFGFGSYARAVGDYANAVFDNARVETVGSAVFGTESLTMKAGETSTIASVRIPTGLNATSPVRLRVVSSDPSVAIPVGGAGGTLTLTFAAGATNSQTLPIKALSTGGAIFHLESDTGLSIGNSLSVLVPLSPGVLLQDDFAATAVDTNKWQLSDQPFVVGDPVYDGKTDMTIAQTAGLARFSGTATVSYWGGRSLKSVRSYTASKDLNLVVEVDRVGIEYTGTAARSGIYLTSGDRSQYVFFGQNLGENGWQYNVKPGNLEKAGGASLTAFSALNTDTNSHRLKMVADGEGVDLYLDGTFGARAPFPVSSGIFVELGTYARMEGDTVTATFDNVKIEAALPPITVAPAEVALILGKAPLSIAVVVPALLIQQDSASITMTSRDPKVAIPSGAVNGSATLTFPAGGSTTNFFEIVPVGIGQTTLVITNLQGVSVNNNVQVRVTAAPRTLLQDDFSSPTINQAIWRTDDAPFQNGEMANSSVTVVNGLASFSVNASVDTWPGLGLATKDTYSAGTLSPLTFEIDRVSQEGKGAETRTGVWVTDAARENYVFFSQSMGNASGWGYNRRIGQADDNPTGASSRLTSLNDARFNDKGKHRLKLVADGAAVDFFVDGTLGGKVPFPFSEGIVFEFGAYAQLTGDSVVGQFDNVLLSGNASTETVGPLAIAMQGGKVVLSWAGPGNLEQTASLPGSWTALPGSSPYTVTNLVTQKFYRLTK